ncbi:MAG: sigma-70 family RNA polymerase sigma factor [Candidatus Hydrogenedentota bacterium]
MSSAVSYAATYIRTRALTRDTTTGNGIRTGGWNAMTHFNADFWEVTLDASCLESIPAERAIWFETPSDRTRRHALQDFFQEVMPAVQDIMEKELTDRQQEVLRLYYFHGYTQQDIAATLKLTQSTVSRHLFGAARNGQKVGGAIPKLRKAIETRPPRKVEDALATLQARFAETG